MVARNIHYRILAAHPAYAALVESRLRGHGLEPAPGFRHGTALVVIDLPQTWALEVLSGLDSFQRSHALVVATAPHPVYRACLASHHVAGVVDAADGMRLVMGVYAAATAQRLDREDPGVTYMELRVTRLLLRGHDTADVAEALGISHKTVNAHVSNILCKLGYDSRAQYIARLLGRGDEPAAAVSLVDDPPGEPPPYAA